MFAIAAGDAHIAASDGAPAALAGVGGRHPQTPLGVARGQHRLDLLQLAVDVGEEPVRLGELEAQRRVADPEREGLLADGRGARTVVVKLRRSDMSILTRSITLPAATTDLDGLTAAAHRVMLDPLEVGPIRLVGVGYSGLSETRQETLFPGLGEFLDEAEAVAAEDDSAASVSAAVSTEEPTTSAAWPTGADVFHAEHGHGWVQGGGHGFVTIRFETRATGPGRAQTFRLPDPTLQRADPLDSLAWELTEAVDGDVTMQAMTL